jgi:calcineurin-like phosphoesterase family protein
VITVTDLKKSFLSSDHHFWHARVIEYCKRPFKDVEEMNEILIKNWNEVVGPEDTVYYLGDFSMAFRSVEIFTKRLNGNKILFAGNHDWVHPANKKSNTPEKQAIWFQKYIDNGWAEVHLTGEIDIPGVGIVNVNHLPYKNPKEQLRHDKFRPIDDGRWLLCGHVHEKWDQRRKMINVGVDVRGFKPMSFEEVAKIILAKPDGYQDFGPNEPLDRARTSEEY